MRNTNPITKAINSRGLTPLADDCGVVYQTVRKWEKHGLPRTEFTGETFHAKNIENATNGSVKAVDLLEWSRVFRQKKKH